MGNIQVVDRGRGWIVFWSLLGHVCLIFGEFVWGCCGMVECGVAGLTVWFPSLTATRVPAQ